MTKNKLNIVKKEPPGPFLTIMIFLVFLCHGFSLVVFFLFILTFGGMTLLEFLVGIFKNYLIAMSFFAILSMILGMIMIPLLFKWKKFAVYTVLITTVYTITIFQIFNFGLNALLIEIANLILFIYAVWRKRKYFT